MEIHSRHFRVFDVDAEDARAREYYTLARIKMKSEKPHYILWSPMKKIFHSFTVSLLQNADTVPGPCTCFHCSVCTSSFRLLNKNAVFVCALEYLTQQQQQQQQQERERPQQNIRFYFYRFTAMRSVQLRTNKTETTRAHYLHQQLAAVCCFFVCSILFACPSFEPFVTCSLFSIFSLSLFCSTLFGTILSISTLDSTHFEWFLWHSRLL